MLQTRHRTVEEVYPARPESVRQARNLLTGFAARSGATEDQLASIRLAVSEAVSNAIRHAYPDTDGVVHLTATAIEDEFWVLVADDGCGHQHPAADPGLGWGLALIADACGQFTLAERSQGGTEARMRFSLGDPRHRV